MSTTKNYLKFPYDRPPHEGQVSKALKFFLTDRGRGIIQFAAGAATLGLSAALLLKETYFVENYIDIIRAYRNGSPMKVSEEFEEKIDACIDKLKFRVQESTFLKAFMVNGFDTRSVGSVNSNHYGYIGIPLNYLYKSLNDVDRINLKMGRESIDWTSKYGQLLEKSLVLTEDEMEFGLLRAALELRNNNFVHGSLIPGACVFGLYVASLTVNQKFGLYQRSRSLRFLSYTILGTFVYGIYSIITDFIRIRQDIKVDHSLAQLGPEICETGIRFYEKLMNRNVALRELSGDHSTYTVKGNENSGWFRWSKLALSTRKFYFKQMLDEARKKETENAEQAEKGATQSPNDTEDSKVEA